MGAKYGETRLVSPTAEVVCLGLAAVLGGVALVPGVRWATTQSRFRCDLGHLRDTVDYAYAVSFFEHGVRRIRAASAAGGPGTATPAGAAPSSSRAAGRARRRGATPRPASGPRALLFSDSEFGEASRAARRSTPRSASVAGAGLAVAAQAASVVLFHSAPLVALGETKVGPGPFLSVAAATLSRLVAASRGVGLARNRAPPAPPDGDVELAARPARRPPSPAALADVEIAQRSPLAALRRAPSSDEDDDEVKSESSSLLGEERPLGELIFHYIDARYRRSSHRRLEDVEAAWCAGLLDAGSLVCGEGLADDWTPVQDVERLRAHLQLLEWKPKTSPVRNRQSLPKDAKFDAGDLADLADDDDDERPARRHSGGTIKLHRRTPSG
ncbi:hypothetical protein JL722_5648 [Aureococcus anophagefferens]|nr:hypothetical protein JL722_5648 [Aureococcus anophagefferens]